MTTSNNTKADRRRALSKVAWQEAFARLNAATGPNWPVGTSLHTPAIAAAELEANAATAAYVERGVTGAAEALAEWERLMGIAIEASKGKRGCGQCGIEKVAEVVMDDGSRACGRCRSGR